MPFTPLVLTGEQRQHLEDWIRRPTTPQRTVERALIVLAAADGQGQRAIARKLGLTRNTVRKWCRRFLVAGLDGLADQDRPGRPRRISAGVGSVAPGSTSRFHRYQGANVRLDAPSPELQQFPLG